MDLYIKLNAEVAGKDKIARLIQYSCRALWDSLDAKNDAHLALIHQLKQVEFILSSFRKRKIRLRQNLFIARYQP
jgi:peroxin-11B